MGKEAGPAVRYSLLLQLGLRPLQACRPVLNYLVHPCLVHPCMRFLVPRWQYSNCFAALRCAAAQVVHGFCAKPWEQVQQERPNEIYIESYCFRARFIRALLGRRGLGVGPERVRLGE
jgi:hypothetical protein